MGSNDIGGARDERGYRMEAQTPRAPEIEADEVFEEMSLTTPEQRSEVLAQAPAYESESDVRYIIVLSNGSRPAPTVG